MGERATLPISTELMNHQKNSILIVDDVKANLYLLSDMLSQKNYQVRKAINGNMALRSVEQSPLHLILLDIQMPGMDGYEVCQHLKADEKTASIPIIFISALDDPLDKVKAFSLGAVDYIPKPFDINEVLARVENQLQLQALRHKVEEHNDDLQKAIRDLENALLESTRLRAKLERANTELVVADKKLGEMAIMDALTQIPNRRRFDEYLDESWEYCLKNQEPISLILGDIDYFKAYNDCYGHQQGDRCLYAVAQAIQKSIILARDLAARYGGEEMAVVLPHADIEDAKVVAERILTEIHDLQIEHDDSKVKNIISMSLGVHTVIPTAEQTIGEFITDCDQALYFAKEHGRDRMSVFQDLPTPPLAL